MNKILIVLGFVFVTFNNYSQQNNTSFVLSTPKQSFEIFCDLLSKKDTVNLKKVVTAKSYKSFHFEEIESLQELAIKWESKKINIIKDSDNEEIIEIQDCYTPLKFVKENNEWKFAGFVFR